METPDFSKHRLNDDTWMFLYTAQLGEEAYTTYFNRVWQLLEDMKVNRYFDVKKVTQENRDLFIKICCLYIMSHKEFEFSNDYTIITRKGCFTPPKSLGKPKTNNS